MVIPVIVTFVSIMVILRCNKAGCIIEMIMTMRIMRMPMIIKM